MTCKAQVDGDVCENFQWLNLNLIKCIVQAAFHMPIGSQVSFPTAHLLHVSLCEGLERREPLFWCGGNIC